MDNPIHKALKLARQWVSGSGLSSRELEAITGVSARSICNFRQPGHDSRVSTLAKIVGAMPTGSQLDQNAPAQFVAQGANKANADASKSHCGTRASEQDAA